MHHAKDDPENAQLPSLKELSSDLGLSVSTLREQLEGAKTIGLVDVRPRTGIKVLPYNFYQAVWSSLSYIIEINPQEFYAFAHLRKKIEAGFWHQAVSALTPDDINDLQTLIELAEEKLTSKPIQIPHEEHRQLHLTIYRRLDNAFVSGILEAYWDAYESIGLSMYIDLAYQQEVWEYHRKMVEAICEGDYEAGYHVLESHADLLHQHPDFPQENISY
jgi:DNA-binding FadR family transcriptional regulator